MWLHTGETVGISCVCVCNRLCAQPNRCVHSHLQLQRDAVWLLLATVTYTNLYSCERTYIMELQVRAQSAITALQQNNAACSATQHDGLPTEPPCTCKHVVLQIDSQEYSRLLVPTGPIPDGMAPSCKCVVAYISTCTCEYVPTSTSYHPNPPRPPKVNSGYRCR